MESCNPRTSLERLPLVTLFLSERCNSRCVSCDYWRHGRADLDLEAVTRLLPSLERLGTQVVLISGGEPLLNPEWAQIAALLGQQGLKVWLLTSGLSLAKHAARASVLFEAITVSLDGTDRSTYAAIRGVDAFDAVCRGIRAVVGANAVVTLRMTVQRGNFRQLPDFIELSRALGVAQVSFLPVDVANSHAFKRHEGFSADLALRAEDLPELQRILMRLEREYADDFRTGFIAENPEKLRRQLLGYLTAVCGLGPFPPVRCNAPEFSAVIDAGRHVSPCFFIGGPPQTVVTDDLGSALNGEHMLALRASIRDGERAECSLCVCSIWRDPGHLDADRELLPRRRDARQ
jgi:MoaA/NifB/PqqE/SkfB family radical SAM enzyme